MFSVTSTSPAPVADPFLRPGELWLSEYIETGTAALFQGADTLQGQTAFPIIHHTVPLVPS